MTHCGNRRKILKTISIQQTKKKRSLDQQIKVQHESLDNESQIKKRLEEANKTLEEKNKLLEEELRKVESSCKQDVSSSLEKTSLANAQVTKLLDQLNNARIQHEAEKQNWFNERGDLKDKIAESQERVKDHEETVRLLKSKEENIENLKERLDTAEKESAVLKENAEQELLTAKEKMETEWQVEKGSRTKALETAFEERFKSLLEEKQRLVTENHEQKNKYKDRIVGLEKESHRLRLELEVEKDRTRRMVHQEQESKKIVEAKLETCEEAKSLLETKYNDSLARNIQLEHVAQDQDSQLQKLRFEINDLKQSLAEEKRARFNKEPQDTESVSNSTASESEVEFDSDFELHSESDRASVLESPAPLTLSSKEKLIRLKKDKGTLKRELTRLESHFESELETAVIENRRENGKILATKS